MEYEFVLDVRIRTAPPNIHTIAKEVVLAYPDFTKPFDIYTDASTKQ